jgi:hypothetical protein
MDPYLQWLLFSNNVKICKNYKIIKNDVGVLVEHLWS